MQDGIVMNTTLDPNAQGGGLMGKLFSGRQARALRQHVLRHDVRQRGEPRQDVAFSSHFPGQDSSGRSARVERTDHRAEGLLPLRGARHQRHHRVHEAHRRRLLRRRGLHPPAHRGRRPRVPARVGHAARDHARRPANRCASTLAVSSRWKSTSTTTSRWCPGIKTALFGGEGLFFARAARSGSRDSADDAVLAPRRPHSRRRAARRRRPRRDEGVGGLGAAGVIGGVIGSMIDNG